MSLHLMTEWDFWGLFILGIVLGCVVGRHLP